MMILYLTNLINLLYLVNLMDLMAVQIDCLFFKI